MTGAVSFRRMLGALPRKSDRKMLKNRASSSFVTLSQCVERVCESRSDDQMVWASMELDDNAYQLALRRLRRERIGNSPQTTTTHSRRLRQRSAAISTGKPLPFETNSDVETRISADVITIHYWLVVRNEVMRKCLGLGVFQVTWLLRLSIADSQASSCGQRVERTREWINLAQFQKANVTAGRTGIRIERDNRKINSIETAGPRPSPPSLTSET